MTQTERPGAFPEPAAQICNRDARAPVLLICDHASNEVPAAFENLGLQSEELETHIAFDRGAASLTAAIGEAIDATYILCGYSRLLIDVNRDPAAADSIVVENDGIRVPANAALTKEGRAERVAHIYEPYHRAIESTLALRLEASEAQIVVAVHSFTPRIGGRERPWDIGVIFNRDRRLASALVGRLVGAGKGRRLTLGLNEPYAPDDRVYHTLERHAEARGLPCVMIELPNDRLGTSSDREEWAGALAGALREIASACERKQWPC